MDDTECRPLELSEQEQRFLEYLEWQRALTAKIIAALIIPASMLTFRQERS